MVFTLPHRLAPLALQNKKVLNDLLFRTGPEQQAGYSGPASTVSPLHEPLISTRTIL